MLDTANLDAPAFTAAEEDFFRMGELLDAGELVLDDDDAPVQRPSFLRRLFRRA